MTPEEHRLDHGIIADHLIHPADVRRRADGWRDCAEQLGHARGDVIRLRGQLQDYRDALRQLPPVYARVVEQDFQRRQRQRKRVEDELARVR